MIPPPNVNLPPMPALAAPGVILNGRELEHFSIDSSRGYPDVRSFRRKFGLLIPATNTSMEHELWTILIANAGEGLGGVGLHTSCVVTPRPQLATEADLREYKRQFLSGLKAAIDVSLLAQPQYLIMGMSLEHIISGLEAIRGVVSELEQYSRLAWATWHDAVRSALDCFGARRIGLLTPFDRSGNEAATRMFSDLGCEVVASVGFSCANALHIAHVPEWAKERAVIELLATDANRLDAVVQCGTNMSMIDVSERLEPIVGIPILGINAVLLWYSLRQNGFATRLRGVGRLGRDF
jgi:maleate isomerase